MLLSPEDTEIFAKLYCSLMLHVNRRLEIVRDVRSPEAFRRLPHTMRQEVRNAFLGSPALIDTFVEENPAGLSDDELQIVCSWRNFVSGRFYVFRTLKKHTVFLPGDDAPIAYGVLAITNPFEDLLGSDLPVLIDTVLLPFRDRIVYDGLLTRFQISFGGGVKRRLNESYKRAKEQMGGVVTSLPAAPRPAANRKPKKKSNRTSGSVRRGGRSASEAVRPILEAVVGMTDEFCREYLNDEYAALCRKMAEKLSRKRPSPLFRGRPRTWAAGIARTIGWVNFLHDSSQTPHMRLMDVDYCFGIAESTGAAKSKEIRTMLRIHQFDHQWMVPSRMDDTPLIWTLEINGFLMDVRRFPREVQELAFKKGLIPYVPPRDDAD